MMNNRIQNLSWNNFIRIDRTLYRLSQITSYAFVQLHHKPPHKGNSIPLPNMESMRECKLLGYLSLTSASKIPKTPRCNNLKIRWKTGKSAFKTNFGYQVWHEAEHTLSLNKGAESFRNIQFYFGYNL